MGRNLSVMILQLLDEHKMTIRELERRTGIRYATLHELANNKRQNINFGHINRIGDALNITDVRHIITFDDIIDDSFKYTGMQFETATPCLEDCKRFRSHSQFYLHNDLLKKVR